MRKYRRVIEIPPFPLGNRINLTTQFSALDPIHVYQLSPSNLRILVETQFVSTNLVHHDSSYFMLKIWKSNPRQAPFGPPLKYSSHFICYNRTLWFGKSSSPCGVPGCGRSSCSGRSPAAAFVFRFSCPPPTTSGFPGSWSRIADYPPRSLVAFFRVSTLWGCVEPEPRGYRLQLVCAVVGGCGCGLLSLSLPQFLCWWAGWICMDLHGCLRVATWGCLCSFDGALSSVIWSLNRCVCSLVTARRSLSFWPSAVISAVTRNSPPKSPCCSFNFSRFSQMVC